MRFFMLSDLHLIDKEEMDVTCKRLKKICTDVRQSTFVGDLVLFIILGDIVDKGEYGYYDKAAQCLDLIKEELNEYNVKFEFVPGNHDLEKDNCNLNCFDNFILRYIDEPHSFEHKSVYSKVYEDVNFIFADSTLSRKPREPGELDLDAIENEVIPQKTNVLFCHHALMQSHGGSHDGINNPQEVYRKLNELNIDFLFHGHVHRTAVSIPEKGMIEIGCGSLTGDTTWEKGLYNQFTVACVQDGQITYIERWVDTSDGSEIYAQNRLYPQIQKFADPNTILKKQYDSIEDYISRKVTCYAERDTFYLPKHELSTVIRKYERVLLLSDAGMGKSVEIQNLAHELCNKMHTILYSLKDYTNQDICEILPVEYRKLSPHRYMLLFDGYDEMSVDCREIFERKIRSFVKEFVGAHIVITSRNNFCHIENNESSRLDGFAVFLLEKLDNISICQFLERKGIDVRHFMGVAQEKNVYDMLPNPFYLINLTRLFTCGNDLPEKSKIMEILIEKSFSVDDMKFSGNLDNQYHNLFCQLEKIAIIMQMMHRRKLDDRMEYQELFQLDIRELSKKSSLLNRNGDAWEFSHNNFREYLSARFLSKLDKERAMSLFSDGDDIKASWINTIGYLMGMELEWNLFDWVKTHSPSAFVKFESDRLSDQDRMSVFERFFCKYEKQSLYINDDLCDERELAAFGKSPIIINFLLDRISSPRNAASQFSAINILRHYTSLFGLNDNVRKCLVSCCDKYPITPKHVCRMCLLVLAEQNLGTVELTKHFMQRFGDCEEDFIRLGMYEYLLVRNEHDCFPQYFLDGLKYIGYGINDKRIGNEQIELARILKRMSTPESVISLLKYFAKEKDFNFYDAQEVVSANVNTAIKLYKNGCQAMYDVAIDCYIVAVKSWNNLVARELARFFFETNTLPSATVFLSEIFELEPHRMSFLFCIDPNAMEYLKVAYLRDELKNREIFHRNVQWYVHDAEKYAEYALVVKEREGFVLPQYTAPIDYEHLRLDGRKQFLSSMFVLQERERLLSELIDYIGNPNIVVGKLLSEYRFAESYSAHWYLQSAIYRYASKSIRVADFFKLYEIDDFIISEVASAIDSDHKITLDNEQKKFMEDVIKKKVDKGIFVDAIKYDDNSIYLAPIVADVLKIILFIEYNLEEKVMLQLTELPYFLFDHHNSNKKYEYLGQHLEKEQIKVRLRENVNSRRVKDMVLKDHFEFFSFENDASISEVAFEICKETSEYSSLRESAWKYLYKTLGADYISREVLPIANGDFLVEINGWCKDLPRELMRQAMERQYYKVPNLCLLAHMLTLGSYKGLKQYYKMVKRQNKPPENGQININGPTEAISSVNNPEYLPILKKLLYVAMRNSFSDLNFRGLNGALTKAFVNCAKESYENTMIILKKCLRRASKNENNFRMCNYIINEVESAHRIKKDVPLTLKEVKTYFSIK